MKIRERSEDNLCWRRIACNLCNNSPHEVYSDDDDDLDLNALTASPSAGPFEDEDQGTLPDRDSFRL